MRLKVYNLSWIRELVASIIYRFDRSYTYDGYIQGIPIEVSLAIVATAMGINTPPVHIFPDFIYPAIQPPSIHEVASVITRGTIIEWKMKKKLLKMSLTRDYIFLFLASYARLFPTTHTYDLHSWR